MFAFNLQDLEETALIDTNEEVSVGEYAGWTNRESWATYLWLQNTESLYGVAAGLHPERLKDLFYRLAIDPSGPVRVMLSDIGDLSKVNFVEVTERMKQL